jgi:hypothetical protein
MKIDQPPGAAVLRAAKVRQIFPYPQRLGVALRGLTQEKFAALIQIDLSTLRNWEQGRREPTGPAKALIRAIAKDPKHVLKALEVV